MKKILAILLAGMMTATALVGCDGGQTSGNSSSGSEDSGSGSTTGAGLAELDADGFVDAFKKSIIL